MPRDEAVRRAAGVMMWHMERGDSPKVARQKAANNEPLLSKDELKFAYDWALAGLRLAAMLESAPDDMLAEDVIARSGIREFTGG